MANLKQMQLMNTDYLKIYVDSCKKYNPLDIFDSRDDVIPSL